jgi:hypothetical protein
MWMQHAGMSEMLEFDLLSTEEFEQFFKFAIVRNPFDRAVSDYYFLRPHLLFGDTFERMVTRDGRWRSLLRDRGERGYRGDHLKTQWSFVELDDHTAVDHVGRFESLGETVHVLRERGLTDVDVLPHVNRGRRQFAHYSHFYRDEEIRSVERAYDIDLQRFGYGFDDRRSELSQAARWMARYRSDRVASVRGYRNWLAREVRPRARSVDGVVAGR